jgi:hypothetical protein
MIIKCWCKAGMSNMNNFSNPISMNGWIKRLFAARAAILP